MAESKTCCHSADSTIHIALNSGNFEQIEKSLKEGDTFCVGEGLNCLKIVTNKIETNVENDNYWKILEIILQQHPSFVDMPLQYGETLLLKNAHILDRLTFLLNLGANPRKYAKPERTYHVKRNGGNVLTYALANHANLECIQMLLALGVDVNVKDWRKETPLMMACKHSNLDTVKTLIWAGADIYAENDASQFPLMFAAQNMSTDSTKIIQTLLDVGFDVNTISSCGENALFHAGNSYENMKYLIEAGSDFHIISDYGCNALIEAVVYSKNVESIESIQLLLNVGSNPNIRFEGASGPATALSIAVMSFIDHGNKPIDLPIIKLLIESDSEVLTEDDHHDSQGYSPYSWFVREIMNDSKKFISNVYKDKNEILSTMQCFYNAVAKSEHEFIEHKYHPLIMLYHRTNLCELKKEYIQDLLISILNSQLGNLSFTMAIESCENVSKYLTDCNVIHNFIGLFLYSRIIDIFKFNEKWPRSYHDYESDSNSGYTAAARCRIHFFDPKIVTECLQILIDFGFGFETEGCVSSLTSLMMFKYDESEGEGFADFEELTPNDISIVQENSQEDFEQVAKFLIEKGADVTTRSLEFEDETLRRLSEELDLPDALWVAAISGRVGCVRLLLPYWTAPPLALLMFVTPSQTQRYQNYDNFGSVTKYLYNVLASGGPLPRGTEMYQRVNDFMERWPSNEFTKHFMEMHSGVPSLLNLSRIALRASLPPGTDLPQRLIDLVPPGLKNFVKLDTSPKKTSHAQNDEPYIDSDMDGSD